MKAYRRNSTATVPFGSWLSAVCKLLAVASLARRVVSWSPVRWIASLRCCVFELFILRFASCLERRSLLREPLSNRTVTVARQLQTWRPLRPRTAPMDIYAPRPVSLLLLTLPLTHLLTVSSSTSYRTAQHHTLLVKVKSLPGLRTDRMATTLRPPPCWLPTARRPRRWRDATTFVTTRMAIWSTVQETELIDVPTISFFPFRDVTRCGLHVDCMFVEIESYIVELSGSWGANQLSFRVLDEIKSTLGEGTFGKVVECVDRWVWPTWRLTRYCRACCWLTVSSAWGLPLIEWGLWILLFGELVIATMAFHRYARL